MSKRAYIQANKEWPGGSTLIFEIEKLGIG